LSKFQEQLEEVKKKLLDLSKRNKFINYKYPAKSKNLRVIDESPEFIYQYLVFEEKTFTFKSIPYPTMMPYYKNLETKKRNLLGAVAKLSVEEKLILSQFKWRVKRAVFKHEVFFNEKEAFQNKAILIKKQELSKTKEQKEKELQEVEIELKKIEEDESFTVEKQAKELGLKTTREMPKIELHHENNFDIHLDRHLQTLHFPDELEKVLKKIELTSRSIMDVTGTNMLYLVLGTLEWRESDKPEVVIRSPLITVPVSLKRGKLNSETHTYEFSLSYTGDAIDTNESLSHKLFNDFGMRLPKLNEEISFNNYMREVEKLCHTHPNWKIKQEVALDFLQFGKILMYKNLELSRENREKLENNPILRDIFLGRTEANVFYASGEYNIDQEPLAKNMPLVLDADSSQHSAMVDVLKGKNVVIEGPPGTGKSQIIANLIAVLMSEGKKVLFVSEKMVALQVVYQRLEQIGLGSFCLELHSHKTNKNEVLQSLSKRLKGTYAFPHKQKKVKYQLEHSKIELNNYLTVLHRKYGENKKTIFENIWSRERYILGKEYFNFRINNAKNLKYNDLQDCETYLSLYESHYADYNLSNSYWSGFLASDLSFMENDKFIDLLKLLKIPYGKLDAEFKALGIEVENEREEPQKLQKFLEGFTQQKKYYFSFDELAVFSNLENKLQAYLKSFQNYLSILELENISTAELIKASISSFSVLEELSSYENELQSSIEAFKNFIAEAEKNFKKFENIEQSNSKNLHLPMVNHQTAEEIFEVVSTVSRKKDSWFRFLSPAYKRSRNIFASLLLKKLPDNTDEWLFLLRELNVYVLNRENKLNLRVMLQREVPKFIEKVQTVHREIKESLDIYEEIYKADINTTSKKLLQIDLRNQDRLQNILAHQREIEQINERIKSYGTLENSFLGEGKSFLSLLKKLDELDTQQSSLTQWIDFQKLLSKLKALGLRAMMESAERKEIPKDKLVDTFYYNYYNSLLEEAFKEYPVLHDFTQLKHNSIVEKFRKNDIEVLSVNQQSIAYELSKNILPQSEGKGRVATFTNLKLIQHEIAKKTRHVPIRQLLKRAGDAVHVLKPCFMMSPLSVAQYLPLDDSKFDVLLIDEASQLKPEEALGTIMRAKQVVVVGDPKQLPPTSFFDSIQEEVADEDKSILDDSESVLDTFMELYAPIRRLKWHYRSQHESLISFSNKHFYDGELTLFPSPRSVEDESLGVKYTYVENGFYKSGSKYRTNETEAQKVLESILYQMEKFPKKSLGVGTLNGTQKELIQELVDKSEKEHLYVAHYLEKWRSGNESFFVKNLESLQGDERDVILISTTYGKEEGNERLMQRFGPINQEDGWRRLNVLISRSKQKMHVFTSMKALDIKTTDSSSRGVKSLKNFLKFLERGHVLKSTKEEEQVFGSDFAKVVYEFLKSKGIKSVPNLGVSGYFLDLAVVSPETGDYTLAIECDGIDYFASKSTSDRDRLKPSVLKRLGWKSHKVWSAEWFKNRELELERLLKAVEDAELP